MTATKGTSATKDPNRQTGRTTRQMHAAPDGAVFVWCNNVLTYPRSLAKKIGREDLQIVGPGFLDGRSRGRRASFVIVDHAARLSREQSDEIAILLLTGAGR